MLLASQNLEDFDQEGIREMTKPLFSIPPHQFLFNAGSIDKRAIWRCSSWMRRNTISSSFPSVACVCTSAATSDICWRYTPLHTRKSCLAQRVAADGSNRGYDRQSRGDSPFQREAPQRDRLGAGRCSLARHPPDRRAVLHRHRRCRSQQPGGSCSLLWRELLNRSTRSIPVSY